MTAQQQNEAIDFVPLLNFNDYEILNVYRVVSESIKNRGYVQVWLNGKHYLSHRLIALQFIHNDDPINKYVVDHINHNRHDNHLSNLR